MGLVVERGVLVGAAVALVRVDDGVGYSLGDEALDGHLAFLAGRCRPDTVRATAFDLKFYFSVVNKRPARVRPANVIAFVRSFVWSAWSRALRSMQHPVVGL